MATGVDTQLLGGSLPSRGAPPSVYRRGYSTSATRFTMPEMEENQFILKMGKETRLKLPVTDDEEEEEEEEEREKEQEGAWATLQLRSERLVVVREDRSWGWKLGNIRRYGSSPSTFYFESGRKSRTGEGTYTFLTDCGERIKARLTMVKEFCQFDLYCQRGVILDLLLVDDPPPRVRSLRDKSGRPAGQNDKKGAGGPVRRISTGSLPY